VTPFGALLRKRVTGEHVINLKVYTPKGHLYQQLDVPFSGAPVPVGTGGTEAAAARIMDSMGLPLGVHGRRSPYRLSGGEQALTALSLLFAVFLSTPAPICVLDEVDAPLDDHNIERFCDLLDEMTRATDTRFLIITHNPITMARMNRLYGVTMAERGISQLVSVDLEGAVKLREAS